MQRARGFTIVELLIVIVVIAILAALSYVGYVNISNRAHDSTVRADLGNFSKQMEIIKLDLGHYPRERSHFTGFKITLGSYDTTANNVYYTSIHASDRYAFGVRSKSGKGFILTDQGLQENVSSISGSATATALGSTWGATGTSSLQGHGSNGWVSGWPLISD